VAHLVFIISFILNFVDS